MAVVAPACSFENDDVYVPQAQAAYFVIQPPGVLPTRIGVVDAVNNSYAQDGSNLGLPAAPVSVSAAGQTLYITANDRLIVRDGITRSLQSEVVLEAGVTAIQATEHGVFVLSPAQQRIWAVLRSGESDRTIPVPFQPTAISSTAGKLLVASADGQSAWVSEQALTVLREATAPDDVFRIVRNSIGRLEVLGRNGTAVARATADAGTESVGAPVNVADTRDIWITPNVRQTYGREYLGTIRWRTDSSIVDARNTVLLTRASSLYVDFGQSYLYATSRDSLYRVDLVTNRRVAAWPEPGRIVAGAAIAKQETD